MTQLSLFAARTAKVLQAEPRGKQNPHPTPLTSTKPVKPEPPVYKHPPRPDDDFWKAHAELTATLLGLQQKMGWPAYQAPWEKAQAAILASFGMSETDFYQELRKRLDAEQNLARSKEDE